jgi:hypothetical protein
MAARPDFWHGPVPVDSVCVYRTGFGLLLCVEVLGWLPHATELFSNDGFHLGPLAHLAPPPPIAAALCIALAATSACVSLGLYTRAATVATLILWLFLYGIDHINEKAISTIVAVVLLILCWAPCGARYALDSRRRKSPAPEVMCALPLRLLQLQFAQVYFFSGIAKLNNHAWVNGTVPAQVLTGRWATELGVWLSGHLPTLAGRIAGLGTILYELLAGWLLFVPWARPWVIAAGVLFHLGIQATLQIGTLGAHFVWALLVLFPDPETVRRLLRSAIPPQVCK